MQGLKKKKKFPITLTTLFVSFIIHFILELMKIGKFNHLTPGPEIGMSQTHPGKFS